MSSNMNVLHLLGVIVVLFFIDVCKADEKATTVRFFNYSEMQILDYLTDSSRYEFATRPDEQTKVNVSVLILTLSSPDESSLKYEIEFLLIQRWEDHRLVFADSKHLHLNGLLHESRIWKPDIYFLKHGEFKTPVTPIHMSLRLYPNGTVIYTLRRHIALVCQGNLKIFPFDNPKCPFAVESMSYEKDKLKIDWSDEVQSIRLASSVRAHNAYLAKNETGYCEPRHTWRGNYSCLRVLLVFTRDKSFYISTVFVPGIVLVTSSFISFWLDINAVPARVMIGVTTMLNFCTTTNSFRSTLPVVSNLTAMNLWDGVCMFFIYASMLEFVIVNYLYRNIGAHRRRYSFSSSVGSAAARHNLYHKGIPLLHNQTPTPKHSTQGGNYEQEMALLTNGQRQNNIAGETVGVDGNMTDTEIRDVDPENGRYGRFQAITSLIMWLRKPQALSTQLPPKPRLAKAIDYFSRTVFPVLFGMFTFGFFLIYAVIGPSAEENWKLIEY